MNQFENQGLTIKCLLFFVYYGMNFRPINSIANANKELNLLR